ncbi:hypothetical protein A2U01_0085686, partial [Trifolium medium]|nr:hypothetical protein [Trifolium medium]
MMQFPNKLPQILLKDVVDGSLSAHSPLLEKICWCSLVTFLYWLFSSTYFSIIIFSFLATLKPSGKEEADS